jgi:hypothetical protein
MDEQLYCTKDDLRTKLNGLVAEVSRLQNKGHTVPESVDDLPSRLTDLMPLIGRHEHLKIMRSASCEDEAGNSCGPKEPYVAVQPQGSARAFKRRTITYEASEHDTAVSEMVIRDTIILDPTGDPVSPEELEGEALNDERSLANMRVGEMALLKLYGYRWIHAKLIRRNGTISSDPAESELADEMEFEISKTGATKVIPRSLFADSIMRSRNGQNMSEGADMRRKAEKDAENEARWTAKAWLVSLNVMSVLGEALLDQKPNEGGLGEDVRVKSLNNDDIEEAVESAAVKLKQMLKDEVKKLKQQRECSATKLNSKFQAEGRGFTLGFGSMKTFDGGLEAYIGTPSPNIEEEMEHEHTCGEWSHEEFTLWGGYKTTAAKEWEYVGSEQGAPEWCDKKVNDGRVREKGRNGWKLEGFLVRYGRNSVAIQQVWYMQYIQQCMRMALWYIQYIQQCMRMALWYIQYIQQCMRMALWYKQYTQQYVI